MVLIDSMPPTTTTLALPAVSSWLAIITVFIPDGQAMLMVTAGTCTGMAAFTDAVRAGLIPFPAWRQLP